MFGCPTGVPCVLKLGLDFFTRGGEKTMVVEKGSVERRIGAKPFIFPCFQLWAFIYKSWKMMVCIWNFFLYQNFLHCTFYIPTSRSFTTITEQNSNVIVKLPEVNFFLQKSASDIFPCSRNIQISKIHATPSPRENTLIIIKLENFKLSRPNL